MTIGGNTSASLMYQEHYTVNAIGEKVGVWDSAVSLVGFLDLMSGDSRHTYNAKIEESTHIFLCDYNSDAFDLADQDTRMEINGLLYDVLLIDNPMGLNEHLEIYLKKVGAYSVS